MVLRYATCENIQMLTFKMITLSQDLYWNSKCEKVPKLSIQVL